MLSFDHVPVKVGKFPNNEVYVDFDFRAHDISGRHMIEMKFEGNDDLIALILLKRTLDDLCYEHVDLDCKFMPYAAQDRTENIRSLGIKYVGELINSLHFDRVYTWEMHSDVGLAMIDRVRNLNYSEILADNVVESILDQGFMLRDVLIVFPDGGAAKRYTGMKENYENRMILRKARDFQTGKVIGMEVEEAAGQKEPKFAILVDDLIRGGRTLCGAAKTVREHYPSVEYVFCCAAHTEDCIYDGVILEDDNIDAIFTTMSCLSVNKHPKLHTESCKVSEFFRGEMI